MKATTLFDRSTSDTALPQPVQAAMHALRGLILRHSQIVWGEHCSECAYPACYSRCSFYSPRADLDCRRFERGIESLGSVPGLDLMQIQFRRWGKLEGRGPAGLFSLDHAARRLVQDARVESLLATPLLPRRVALGLIHRWNDRKAGATADTPMCDLSSHFVIETWLDPERHRAAIPFTLTVVDSEKASDSLFQARFDIAPGYGRALFATSSIARLTALDRPFLIQIEPVGDAPPVPIVFGLTEFVQARPGSELLAEPAAPANTAPAKKTKTAKCVVWDLDETLWSGILAEDGLTGLALKPQSVDLIRALDARGILLSVASKNDPEPALAALKHFGLREYFLFPQIGWGPKSVSVRQIAELLDIGIDTFVFIDDQPFERAEVAEGAPGVTVFDAADIETLSGHALFDVPATAEAAGRRAMYQTEEIRQVTFQASGSDYLDFLRGCQIMIEVDSLTPDNLERIYELTQRTNQLNFSGTRYERSELVAMMNVPGRAHVVRCSDRFGDYGIVGFVVADPHAAVIESFFMSCRVQRKHVEHALFGYLQNEWGYPPVMRARFRQTEKNGASVRLLESLGFVHAGDEFVRHGQSAFEDAAIVRLRTQPTGNKARA